MLDDVETVKDSGELEDVVVVVDAEREEGTTTVDDDGEGTMGVEDDVSVDEVDWSIGEDVADVVGELDVTDVANEEDIAEGVDEDDVVKMTLLVLALPPMPTPRSDPAADTDAVVEAILEVTAVGLL